jgi:hypothetical protein
MTSKKSDPPSLALWILRHTSPGDHNEALTGDLIERLREGQPRSWLWRQVFFASAVGVFEAIRRRWSFFCYAIAGTAAMCVFSDNQALRQVSWSLHWSNLPWPLSQFVFELSSPAIVALTSLWVLAIGLLIERSFRWVYLLRTGIINLVLIAIGHYSIDLFPWLLRPVPGYPYLKALIVPGVVQVLLLASAFLIAAWLGCPLVDHVHKSERRTADPQ